MSPVAERLYKGIKLKVICRIAASSLVELFTKVCNEMSLLAEHPLYARMGCITGNFKRLFEVG